MLTKRQRDWLERSPYYRNRKRINLIRPPGYRSNQAWQDWSAMKYIARNPINFERNFVDYSYAAANITNAWQLQDPAVGCLNAVANGDGASARKGLKVQWKSIHIRGSVFVWNSLESIKVRILVVRDKQTNSAALTPADVMVSGVDGFRNLEFTSRFDILTDKTMVLSNEFAYDAAAQASRNNQKRRHFQFNMKLNDTTRFNGTTADISDIVDNSYHVLTCASEFGCRFEYFCRMRFLDP